MTLQNDKVTMTTETDENGRYRFTGIPLGIYTVTPEKEDYFFTPRDQIVAYPTKTQGVNFKRFDNLIESISVMTPCGSTVVQTGGKMRVMAVARYKNGKDEIATSFINWESLDADIMHMKDNALFTKFAVADHPGRATILAGTNYIMDMVDIEVSDQYINEADNVIAGIYPPESYPASIDGVCIDTCLWSMIQANGQEVTMEEVNRAGKLHLPGFGLTSMEISPILNFYHIVHKNKLKTCLKMDASNFHRTYEEVFREEVLENVKQGIPVMFSLKYLPDYAPYMAVDHYVLAVGYNEGTDEVIYYDMNQTYRSKVTKLTDGSFGYSTVNSFGMMNIIEFSDYKSI